MTASERIREAREAAELRESCGSCGGDLGPSTVFVWHYEEEDCRAIREPLTSVEIKAC